MYRFANITIQFQIALCILYIQTNIEFTTPVSQLGAVLQYRLINSNRTSYSLSLFSVLDCRLLDAIIHRQRFIRIRLSELCREIINGAGCCIGFCIGCFSSIRIRIFYNVTYFAIGYLVALLQDVVIAIQFKQIVIYVFFQVVVFTKGNRLTSCNLLRLANHGQTCKVIVGQLFLIRTVQCKPISTRFSCQFFAVYNLGCLNLISCRFFVGNLCSLWNIYIIQFNCMILTSRIAVSNLVIQIAVCYWIALCICFQYIPVSLNRNFVKGYSIRCTRLRTRQGYCLQIAILHIRTILGLIEQTKVERICCVKWRFEGLFHGNLTVLNFVQERNSCNRIFVFIRQFRSAVTTGSTFRHAWIQCFCICSSLWCTHCNIDIVLNHTIFIGFKDIEILLCRCRNIGKGCGFCFAILYGNRLDFAAVTCELARICQLAICTIGRCHTICFCSKECKIEGLCIALAAIIFLVDNQANGIFHFRNPDTNLCRFCDHRCFYQLAATFILIGISKAVPCDIFFARVLYVIRNRSLEGNANGFTRFYCKSTRELESQVYNFIGFGILPVHIARFANPVTSMFIQIGMLIAGIRNRYARNAFFTLEVSSIRGIIHRTLFIGNAVNIRCYRKCRVTVITGNQTDVHVFKRQTVDNSKVLQFCLRIVGYIELIPNPIAL